jgi:outer membrane murein-binding lipoprotein Lpp
MQKINEVAQKKAELQAQIDALKLEMETLTI